MNKFALIQCVNGNFSVVSEHSSENEGIIAFHQVSAALWNAPDVITATLNLVNQSLEIVDGKYTEWINRNDQA